MTAKVIPFAQDKNCIWQFQSTELNKDAVFVTMENNVWIYAINPPLVGDHHPIPDSNKIRKVALEKLSKFFGHNRGLDAPETLLDRWVVDNSTLSN